MTTTPNGVPIILCAECNREHPQGKRHCDICGRPSAFINDNGLPLDIDTGRVSQRPGGLMGRGRR